jgi:hypothetical protein
MAQYYKKYTRLRTPGQHHHGSPQFVEPYELQYLQNNGGGLEQVTFAIMSFQLVGTKVIGSVRNRIM